MSWHVREKLAVWWTRFYGRKNDSVFDFEGSLLVSGRKKSKYYKHP